MDFLKLVHVGIEPTFEDTEVGVLTLYPEMGSRKDSSVLRAGASPVGSV